MVVLTLMIFDELEVVTEHDGMLPVKPLAMLQQFRITRQLRHLAHHNQITSAGLDLRAFPKDLLPPFRVIVIDRHVAGKGNIQADLLDYQFRRVGAKPTGRTAFTKRTLCTVHKALSYRASLSAM